MSLSNGWGSAWERGTPIAHDQNKETNHIPSAFAHGAPMSAPRHAVSTTTRPASVNHAKKR